MIDTAAGVLGELGVAPGRIHVERFTPAPGAGRPGWWCRKRRRLRPGRLIYDGKTNTVPWPRASACWRRRCGGAGSALGVPRGACCSSCRARLTEGSVTLAENFSLEKWELEAGYVLTCQAAPHHRTG